MKAGTEIHFLSGQLFTLGIAAVAILPRMPSDQLRSVQPSASSAASATASSSSAWTIGGRLSFPFRRALLLLIQVGLARVVCFHIFPPSSHRTVLVALDAALGVLHVVGQTFLCLTTAYLLQTQLVQYIHIDGGRPGRNLVPIVVMICILTTISALGSQWIHPTWTSCISLAEALSCFPVIQALLQYGRVSTAQNTTMGSEQYHYNNSSIASNIIFHNLRGPILVQTLIVSECWYLITSLLSFLAQVCVTTMSEEEMNQHGGFAQFVVMAIRHNQDNGVDDWTRLLLHAVFWNSMDEMTHVTSVNSSSSNANRDGGTGTRDTGTMGTEQWETVDPSQDEGDGMRELTVATTAPLTLRTGRDRRPQGASITSSNFPV